MATIAELEKLAINSNIKVVILVGKYADDDYRIVKVDADGKVVTTA